MLKYHVFNVSFPQICWVVLRTCNFTILLSQPPKSWNFTCGQPCSANENFVVDLIVCVCVCVCVCLKQEIFLSSTSRQIINTLMNTAEHALLLCKVHLVLLIQYVYCGLSFPAILSQPSSQFIFPSWKH